MTYNLAVLTNHSGDWKGLESSTHQVASLTFLLVDGDAVKCHWRWPCVPSFRLYGLNYQRYNTYRPGYDSGTLMGGNHKYSAKEHLEVSDEII